jgi:dTDP-4-amino-4,6-dideoxygalactose transaminase
MQKMLDAGISTRRGAMNAHREAAYPAGTWRAAGPLRESEAAQEAAIVVPLFHQLSESDQDRVIEELARAVEAARAVGARA